MPKICQITGKKTEVGMNVSHSHARTKRTFKPNLHPVKIYSEILGKEIALLLSTNAIRTLDKHGGLDSYLLAKGNSKLSEDMIKIKKEILKKQSKSSK